MQRMRSFRNILLATSATVLLAGCVSDSIGSSSGSGGSGATAASVPQLGVTGDGGVTSDLGLSSVTDPLLGTTGLLGGGSDGLIGGAVPSSALAPLGSALAPVTSALAPVTNVLDTGLAAVPSLGVTGDGGLLDDLIGIDPLTPVIGTDGLVADLVGGGSSGLLGGIVPPGLIPIPTGGSGSGLPSLPGLSGLPGLSTLSGGTSGGGLGLSEYGLILTDTLSGLANGADQTALTNIVTDLTQDPAGTLGGVLQIVGTVAGGAGSGSDLVSSVVGTATSLLPPQIAAPVEQITTPVASTLDPVVGTVTSALSPVLSKLPTP